MWGHTRRHHTRNNESREVTKKDNRSNWRELFKDELKSHSEQGLYLKGLRIRDGYTQAELGKLINVSQNNISAMEHGTRPIGKEIAMRLAKVFQVRYQRFL